MEDRRISAKSIAEQLGISRERVGSIIHEDLDMQKLSAKWVPECLNADQKHQLLISAGVTEGHLKEKRCRKVTKGVLFLHDNAPAHWALATQKTLAYLGFQCLDHPPYSPGMVQLDYHLFRGWKNN